MQDFKHHLRDPAVKDATNTIRRLGLTLKFKSISLEIYAPNGLLLIELYSKAQILHFARELATAPPEATPDDTLQRLLIDLQAELSREREQYKTLTAQHALLQSRLSIAEQQLQIALAANAAEPRRYSRLKMFLAKEFHPDRFHGPTIEKRYRTEIFKLIWTQIDTIEKS